MINKFIQAFCNEFNVSREVLTSVTRNQDIVDFRYVCYYVINKYNPGISRRAIGKYFDKNHATVYHGIQEINNLIGTNPHIKDLVEKSDRIYKTLLIIRRKNSEEFTKMFSKNETGMRIYIAGKITGEDYGQAVEKFNAAKRELSGKGYEVISPVEISPFLPEKEWQDYMNECIPILMTCDSIYLLNDWGQSRGARIEYAIAREMGIDIKFQN